MEEVKISVITVCYNAVDTLEKTIQSVLEQTYHNIEYIIIDVHITSFLRLILIFSMH